MQMMLSRDFFLLFPYVFSTVLCLLPRPPSFVVTPSGVIEGDLLYHDGIPVARFLGIPFAKPPIGDLRFRRPVPPARPWNQTLSAREMRSGCVQYSPNPFPWLDDRPGLSEDCLYLNVWAPVGVKKSVMFWIHGGGFRISSSRVEYFDGLILSALGDVVVVTTNYRLGPEGFLYSGTEDAPGNMGLLDLVEALKWVRGNIASFGGDPDSITLFGQSAGGIAVGMFCVSPLTRGLFKRAILQSGSPTNLDGEDNCRNFRVSQRLAEAVGCADNENSLADDPETVVECLRNIDPFILTKALSKVTANSSRSYYPQFGDALLPKNPRQAIMDGDFEAVDLLIGSNNGDGATLITKTMKDVFGFFGEKDPQINITFGESIIKKNFRDYPDPEAVVQQYLSDVSEDDYYTIRRQVFTASGDYARTCPSVYLAEKFAEQDALVYYYYFKRHSSAMPWAPWMLAVHFDETPFVFGHPISHAQDYTQGEVALSRRMIRAWSDFAKTGTPSAGQWPLYSKENPRYEVLDVDTFETGQGPHQSNCNFFRSAFGV